MGEVVVVAIAKSKEGRAEEARALMSEVAAESRKEEGCIAYDLHVDKNDDDRIVLLERWESQDALDHHFTLPHTARVTESLDMLEELPQLYFCEAVGG
jgi:quinol monooxygenase YgiN